MREGGEDEQRPMERSSEHKRRGGRRVSSGERREGDRVALSGNLASHTPIHISSPSSVLIGPRQPPLSSFLPPSSCMAYPFPSHFSPLASGVINHRLPAPLLYPRLPHSPLNSHPTLSLLSHSSTLRSIMFLLSPLILPPYVFLYPSYLSLVNNYFNVIVKVSNGVK